jgi:hypothetical protein
VEFYLQINTFPDKNELTTGYAYAKPFLNKKVSNSNLMLAFEEQITLIENLGSAKSILVI